MKRTFLVDVELPDDTNPQSVLEVAQTIGEDLADLSYDVISVRPWSSPDATQAFPEPGVPTPDLG